VRSTGIPAVKLISPVRHRDGRGFFAETYNRRALAEAGINVDFIQDNLSLSTHAGTLRGLHFQAPPHAQTKLVWVLRGAAIDVAVDLRHGSPTFGRHVMVELNADDGTQVLIPRGFAHGILTLMPDTMMAYKVDAYYASGHDLEAVMDQVSVRYLPSALELNQNGAVWLSSALAGSLSRRGRRGSTYRPSSSASSRSTLNVRRKRNSLTKSITGSRGALG
jgi:dTDP-4-dehydrorhamnose 3,5-epimerase